jgi:hypothetical protein
MAETPGRRSDDRAGLRRGSGRAVQGAGAARPGARVLVAGVALPDADRATVAVASRRHAPDVPVIDGPSTDDGAMTEVTGTAAGLACPGGTALLAPAAGSDDGHPRGATFEAAVGTLDSP